MKIGLVPIAAKPYHAGHHWLVEKAANENDHVILFVSTSDRIRRGEHPIKGKDMMRVWEEELEDIMPNNVSIRYGGSPVQKVYQEIIDGAEAGVMDTFLIYSDAVDTMQNYPEANRIKYMEPLYSQGQVIFPAEEDPKQFTRGSGSPNVSGTAMRRALQTCSLEDFQDGLPQGVDPENVYNILCQNVTEQNLRTFIRHIIVG